MSDVIREFLVGLGFKIDATSEKKFVEGVQKATEQALALGAAMQAVAATITAAVVKIARDMDQMAYASERLGSSVKDIKAVSYAIGQMGGSAQGALSSMEGIARFMRNSPGGTGFIRHLVGDKVDVKDTAAVMDALAVKFREMPYYLAKARAEVIGIDEQTLQAMVRGLDKFSAEYKAKMGAAGLNPEKLAADSKKFMQTWNGMWQSVELVGQKIAANLMPYLGREIERFAEWLDKHTAKISYYVTRFAEAALEVATFIRDAIFRLGDIDPAVKRVLAVLGALMGVAWALGGPIRILLLLGAAILLLYDDYKAWKEGAPHLIDWDKWAPAIQNAWEWIKKIASAINSAAEAVGGWQNVAMAFAAYMATKWVADILGAFTKVGDGASKLAKGGPGRMGLLGLLGVAGGSYMAYQYGKDAIDGVMDRLPATAHQREVYEKEKNLSTWDRAKRVGRDVSGWVGSLWGGKKSGGAATPSGPRELVPTSARAADGTPLTWVTTNNGKRAQVAAPYAPQFQGFLDDLGAAGYKFRDLGGHSHRVNVNNPSRLSKHAYGLAIDVNQHANPNRNTKTDLPPETAALAKKWGLGWGMNWKSVKDPMHFSAAPNEGGRLLSEAELAQLGWRRRENGAEKVAKELQKTFGITPGSNGKPSDSGPIAAKAEEMKRAFNPSRFDDVPMLGSTSNVSSQNNSNNTLHQKTEIHVNGSGDPAAIASAVERSQFGLNQQMLRNFASAHR